MCKKETLTVDDEAAAQSIFYRRLWFVTESHCKDEISKREQAERALRYSENKYRAIMEAMEDSVYICSPDNIVEYMNPAMIKKTGRDATGESCSKAIFDMDEKCQWCAYNKIKEGKSVEFNMVNQKDNRSYHISNAPIDHGDGSISMMAVMKETTDIDRLEAALLQSQKMGAIGTLAGGIAHDFNNILSAIFGYTELLILGASEGSPIRKTLDKILMAANRAKELVTQILTFSRQTHLELNPIKIQPIIKEALKLLKSTLPSMIEISQNIHNDCGPVMADMTQVHQVVMNLVTNAYQVMADTGGKVTLSLKQVELAAADLMHSTMNPGTYNCLVVADNGPGMDKDTIALIFDPYFTTKEKGKGTGLGLSVTHGIVKGHGGHISVYSEEGKGTEFKVYLPVAQTSWKVPKIEWDTHIQKGDEHILLVDDENTILQMEKEMLEFLGYQVTARSSSIGALSLFRNSPNKFDIVITDMTIPKMTGDKLAGELMKIRNDIPIILCTGFSEKMTSEKAAYLGIRDFLMKPITIKELSSKIRKVLENT